MAVLIVPELDKTPWPTLGPQVCDFIEDRCIFGPGSLAGQPAKLDVEARAALYRMYEVYPKGHKLAGTRRFTRVGLEWRKGLAKTEKMAWIAFAELHPEAPVRCDGFDAYGQPVGRPVNFPYIPLMATSEEQVSDLAYGVLKYVVEEGPDADLFDSSLERIIRLSPTGQNDGQCLPVSTAPNARDGALTTFQGFDEPHRIYSPRQRHAHDTMLANIPKRPMEQPWSLYTSTAGKLGQGSVQEDLRKEAEQIARGKVRDPRLFFFSRFASDGYDLRKHSERVKAIAEATGPVGEWGPGQFHNIAAEWDRVGADHDYLERVWLNRWVSDNTQAWDADLIDSLARPGEIIRPGRRVTLGFDGARRKDATAIVATDIETGLQQIVGLWEKPEFADDWEVPESEVTDAVATAFQRWHVHALYGDPPYWVDTMGKWAQRWEDRVVEWWTNRHKAMAYLLVEVQEALQSGQLTFGGSEQDCADLVRHYKNAGKRELRIRDDEGNPMWNLKKVDDDQERKFDACMASVLSWAARLDAIKQGADTVSQVPMRIR